MSTLVDFTEKCSKLPHFVSFRSWKHRRIALPIVADEYRFWKEWGKMRRKWDSRQEATAEAFVGA